MKKTTLSSLQELGDIFGQQDVSKQDKKSPKRRKKNRNRKQKNKDLGSKKPTTNSTVKKVSVKVTHPKPVLRDTEIITRTVKSGVNNLELEKIFDNTDLQKLSSITEVSKSTKDDLTEYESRISSSQYGFSAISRNDKILVLGFDLGSTCSKIVVRFPYETIKDAPEAIPAVPCMAVENNPYYWKSEVFLNSDGLFTLMPDKKIKRFNDLKMAFIRRAEGKFSGINEKDIPIIAYIALMTKQALGWISKRHPKFSSENVTAELNFGFPAKSFEESASLIKYKKVLILVAKILEEKNEVSLCVIKNIIEKSKVETIKTETEVSVVPEIVAAVSGFANSTEATLGEYLIIDIGGLSIDYAFFSIRNYPNSTEINFGIVSAGSKKHGVEILNNSKRPQKDMCRVLYMNVLAAVEEAYQKLYFPGRVWRGADLPVFLTGGGRNLAAYRNVVQMLNVKGSTTKYFRKGKLRDIHRFYGLDHSLIKDRIPNRLIVAYGLSFPALEIPDWYTPDQHKPVQQMQTTDLTTSYIGPEQV